MSEPELVVGGRLTLASGTRSCDSFWLDQPYVPYHWLVGLFFSLTRRV